MNQSGLRLHGPLHLLVPRLLQHLALSLWLSATDIGKHCGKTRKTEKSVEIHEFYVIRTSGSLGCAAVRNRRRDYGRSRTSAVMRTSRCE
jgi:hypothetical protein